RQRRDPPVAATEHDGVADDHRRAVDLAARREFPEELAGLHIDAGELLVASTEDDAAPRERRRAEERLLRVREGPAHLVPREVDAHERVVVVPEVGAVAVEEDRAGDVRGLAELELPEA